MESPAGDDVLANSITTMKTKSLKMNGGKFLLAGLAAVAISLGSAKAAQPDDQIAVQLGAIYLGTPVSNSSNATTLANALYQGRAILKATSKLKGDMVGVQGAAVFTANMTQTTLLQSQILAATEAALASPITNLSGVKNIVVNLSTPNKTAKVTAVFNPAKTTASAIAAIALKRTPNFGPEIAGKSVAAAMSKNGTVAIFGYKNDAAQLTDAGKAAGLALSSALKPYKAGTQNWIAVPSTGALPGTRYLPNFNKTPLPTSTTKIVSPGVQQQFNVWGISNAAAAVSASAIKGLGVTGQTASNVQSLTTALVKRAASFQKLSTAAVTPTSVIGSVGAATEGIVSQLAGDKNNNWENSNAVLKGIVLGAVKASKANYVSIAKGLVMGFTATYLATMGGNDVDTLAVFKAANANDISNAFVTAGALKSTGTGALNTILEGIIDQTYTAFGYNAEGKLEYTPNIASLSGAAGLNYYGLDGGVPSPVTDTVGL